MSPAWTDPAAVRRRAGNQIQRVRVMECYPPVWQESWIALPNGRDFGRGYEGRKTSSSPIVTEPAAECNPFLDVPLAAKRLRCAYPPADTGHGCRTPCAPPGNN